MNAKALAIGRKVGKVVKGIGSTVKKVGGYLAENQRLNQAAASVMDKKYPGGWAQSASNMSELQSIRKTLK